MGILYAHCSKARCRLGIVHQHAREFTPTMAPLGINRRPFQKEGRRRSEQGRRNNVFASRQQLKAFQRFRTYSSSSRAWHRDPEPSSSATTQRGSLAHQHIRLQYRKWGNWISHFGKCVHRGHVLMFSLSRLSRRGSALDSLDLWTQVDAKAGWRWMAFGGKPHWAPSWHLTTPAKAEARAGNTKAL